MFDGTTAETMTPRQIADSVKKSARLRAAETELSQLKARHAECQNEIRRLHSESRPPGAPSRDDDVRRIDTEMRELVTKITPLRREVVELQSARGEQVRQALRPMIAEAAERGHDALVQLSDALDALSEINRELTRARSPEFYFVVPDLDMLTQRLARLAGR